MRKIRIDAAVEGIAAEFKNNLDKHKTEIQGELNALMSCFDGTHRVTKGSLVMAANDVKKCHDYVKKLINDYGKGLLTLMKPNSFESTYQDYSVFLKDSELKWKISIDGDDNKTIHKRITEAMGYQDYVRDEIFPALIRAMGIKACVYCNANYVVSTKDGKGYFELDHWKPESKYPFLCTSFYNLQPCCSHCNKHKSANTKYVFLKLYEEDPNALLDVFEFQIPRGSLVRYFNMHDTSRLKLLFKAVDASCEKLRNDADKRFGIEGIYNEHLDVVEEMMWRAQFYNNVIVSSMTWIYEKRRPMIDIPRFKLGTYAELDEVHKRPLTKMMQDVGKQLEII